MPHLYDLPGNLTQYVGVPNVEIGCKVVWRGRAKVVTGTSPGGFPIFSTTFSEVTVDLSNRVVKGGIGISYEKPIMPQDNGQNLISASEISIELINTDTNIAVAQDGSKMDISAIEGGMFYIWATVTGATPDLDMFRGRCIGTPDEQYGRTIFRIRNIFWEALKKPLVYERLNGISGNVLNLSYPNTYVSGNTLINQVTQIIQAGGYMENYDGYCAWTEDGEIITTVEVSDRTKIEMTDILIKNECPLGHFTIRFTGGLNYRVSTPDGTSYYGNTSTDFDSPQIQIKSSYWVIGAGITELKDEEIKFQTRLTFYGNPVTIIKNLLEKCLLQNWGQLPSDTTQQGFAGATLPVNWETFDALESQWRNYRIYFSESNSDNSVFQKYSGNKPINCLTVCQTIADHIGASILFDNTGNIYIQSCKIGEASTIHDLTGAEAIVKGSFVINANRKPNLIVLNYGRNDRTGNFGASKQYDLRADADYDIEDFNLNLPYYKAGVSKWKAQEICEIFIKRNLASLVTCSFEVTPQYGIGLIPGDRVRIISTEQPEITIYAEISSVSKRVASSTVQVEAFRIQEPEGVLPAMCAWTLCETSLA